MSVKGGNAVSENLTSGREQEWTLHAHVVSKGADEVISQVCALERQEFPENNSESELLRDLRRFKRCLLLICSRPDVGLAGFVLISWTTLAGHIVKLVVNARHRRQGCGQALLATALSKFKEFSPPPYSPYKKNCEAPHPVFNLAPMITASDVHGLLVWFLVLMLTVIS
ncbi:hypothetical protein CYMTET_45767 [Cymbomonas tetramitiformis]|uniref:N-acetyltransferase domain-containing protein n=1 Tax=Cymbomonas tetramitiformis TaxID=36881 RepID=A0AAE0EY95_9CHLO|nr:hypothetical protein CYMTET_45767 [Cymbomonas tetramitiformis]